MSRSVVFAARALRRDLRSGDLRVLALALVVAVASITAVGFFTDRVGRAVVLQAADVLAADLVASAGLPLPDGLAEAARERGLDVARHVTFPSVVINERSESQLVSVKAVSDGYPLRGTLQLSTLDAPDGDAPLDHPAAGTAWVDAQLLDLLALEQGDRLELGASTFAVTRIIRLEPDQGQTFAEFAPRVMIGLEDLAAAELLGPGSRARFALLTAGDPAAVGAFRDWLESEHGDTLRIADVRDGNPQTRRALERAERFLGLASVVTVLLAGAAIALAVRQFALRQADASAVMRTLGATRREVILWLVLRLSAIAVVASAVGVAIGWGAQLLLTDLLRGWFALELPAPGLVAPVVGTLCAFVALAGFGLLPVLRAGRVPVMRVLQRDYSGIQPSVVLTTLTGLLATWLVLLLLSRDLVLSAIVLLGVVAMLSVFAVFGRVIIALVRRVAGARHRLAVAGLSRRSASSVVQLAAFAMGIMALLLISIVRVDILSAWERDLPEDAPNVFVLNVQPDQVEAFAARLDAQGIEYEGLAPMVRARLVAHNDEAIESRSAGARERMRREYNLSYTRTLPPSNEIAAGAWWPTDGSAPPSLSLEADWAAEAGFALGDTLTFRAAGVERTGTVTSLREVDWESFQVNFFAIGSTSLLEGLPTTYVTSFYTDEDFVTATTGWAREFPGVVTLDIGAIMDRVKSLMERASMAVEYVFFFTLLAGVCVLLAAVQSSQAERVRESALLRALGASHVQVRRMVVVEFAVLGAIAGFLAALFATAIGWALSRFVFELPFSFNLSLWLLGVFGGTVGIALAGYLATRRVLHTPPVEALRHAN